jgi:hypothetical protein
MRVYTAYEKAGPAGPDSDSDVVLIKEGASFLALVLPLLWPIYHGMWLVLLGQIIIAAGLVGGRVFLELGDLEIFILASAFMVAMGFQANDMRRWTLLRKGFSFSGVVAGNDIAEAERRLFTALGPHIYMP